MTGNTSIDVASARCAACGELRGIGQMLRVRDRAGLQPDALICRPSVRESCFGYVDRGAHAVSIELAKPWPRGSLP